MSIFKDVLLVLAFSVPLMFASLAKSAPIKPIDYFDPGKVGDTWTYEDLSGSQFTLERSVVVSGPNVGRTKIGNETRGAVFSVNGDSWTLYELDMLPLGNPATFLESYDTGILYTIDNTITHDGEFLFLTLPSFTIQAGTFADVLIQIWLDSKFSPNDKNDLFGLGALGIAAGVTDVNWWARGVGEIKFMGVDAETGNIDGGYELIGLSVPEPATLALLGLGLAGLGFSRRKTA